MKHKSRQQLRDSIVHYKDLYRKTFLELRKLKKDTVKYFFNRQIGKEYNVFIRLSPRKLAIVRQILSRKSAGIHKHLKASALVQEILNWYLNMWEHYDGKFKVVPEDMIVLTEGAAQIMKTHHELNIQMQEALDNLRKQNAYH